MCHADAAESFSCREGVRISPAPKWSFAANDSHGKKRRRPGYHWVNITWADTLIRSLGPWRLHGAGTAILSIAQSDWKMTRFLRLHLQLAKVCLCCCLESWTSGALFFQHCWERNIATSTLLENLTLVFPPFISWINCIEISSAENVGGTQDARRSFHRRSHVHPWCGRATWPS
jgi:hypothetical protein